MGGALRNEIRMLNGTRSVFNTASSSMTLSRCALFNKDSFAYEKPDQEHLKDYVDPVACYV